MTFSKEIKSRAINFLLPFVLFGIAAIVYITVEKNNVVRYGCMWYNIFHIYCPGCGGTRMVIALIDGNINQAFRYNPFLFITLPLIIPFIVYTIVKYVITGIIHKYTNTILIIYAISLLMFGILRNIETFKFLAPTNI